jgi:hypothetical protein
VRKFSCGFNSIKVCDPLRQPPQGLGVDNHALQRRVDSTVKDIVALAAHRHGGTVAGLLAYASDTATADVRQDNGLGVAVAVRIEAQETFLAAR